VVPARSRQSVEKALEPQETTAAWSLHQDNIRGSIHFERHFTDQELLQHDEHRRDKCCRHVINRLR